MDRELLELIISRVVTGAGLTAVFFAIRKCNQHLKLLSIKEPKLVDKTFFDFYFDWGLGISYFYVMFPFYLKYDRNKSEEELGLERRLGTSITMFWICMGIGFFVAIIGGGIINKYL